jgi:hypothetical protein
VEEVVVVVVVVAALELLLVHVVVLGDVASMALEATMMRLSSR